jgi:hypothetical protein
MQLVGTPALRGVSGVSLSLSILVPLKLARSRLDCV